MSILRFIPVIAILPAAHAFGAYLAARLPHKVTGAILATAVVLALGMIIVSGWQLRQMDRHDRN